MGVFFCCPRQSKTNQIERFSVPGDQLHPESVWGESEDQPTIRNSVYLLPIPLRQTTNTFHRKLAIWAPIFGERLPLHCQAILCILPENKGYAVLCHGMGLRNFCPPPIYCMPHVRIYFLSEEPRAMCLLNRCLTAASNRAENIDLTLPLTYTANRLVPLHTGKISCYK